MVRHPLRKLRLAAALGATLGLAACGRPDCGEAARMGDFEYSQGNYPNAIKHYERSLKLDADCAQVKGKLADARARQAALERGGN